jgi:hypothetical protein
MSSQGTHQILFPGSGGDRNRHTGDLMEHTGDLFRRVVCSRYDVILSIVVDKVQTIL